MINKECTCASGSLAESNNWLFITGQSDYMLNEICHAMEWFDFADYVIKWLI